VRRTQREKYLGGSEARKYVLLSAIGIWKERTDIPDSAAYIRRFTRRNPARDAGARIDRADAGLPELHSDVEIATHAGEYLRTFHLSHSL
jgi:hypothetical protein